MVEARYPTAAAVIIGDEILSGRTQDRNLNLLARTLDGLGIQLREARIVPDESNAIVAAVRALRSVHDHIFTSGGIGPTHDDITADAIANAFGVPIDVREDARAILESYYPSDRLNESRLRMARIPDGAELVENPVSGAPGFRLGNVWVLAGVPSIFEAMLEGIAVRLGRGATLFSRSISASVPEGSHAEALGEIAAAAPGLKIGSYPFARAGRIGTTIVVRGLDASAVDATAAEVRALLLRLGADDLREI